MAAEAARPPKPTRPAPAAAPEPPAAERAPTSNDEAPSRDPVRTLRSGGGPDTQEDGPVERWRRVVDAIRLGNPKLGAFLDHAEVYSVGGDEIRLGIDKNSMFHGEVTSPATRAEIADAAERVFGQRPAVVFESSKHDSLSPSSETVFARDKEARARKEREDIERARAHPVVLEAVRIFGARVKNIELPKSDG